MRRRGKAKALKRGEGVGRLLTRRDKGNGRIENSAGRASKNALTRIKGASRDRASNT